MAGLTTALNSFAHLSLRAKVRDDDGIDQLHHFVTVAVLAFFAALTGVVEYAGEPINCWNSGNYLWKHFQEHVNTFCWTHPLYHYPVEHNHSVMPYELNAEGGVLDTSLKIDESTKVNFFRYVTIIFLIQAFLFKIPNMLWGEFNAYSGSNIVKIVEMLQEVLFAKPEEKQEKLQQVALFLEQWLRLHRKPHWFLKEDVSPMVKKTMSYCMVCVGNDMSNYLSLLYLLTKGLYLLNTLFQFIILSTFLHLNFWHFGVRTLQEYSAEQNYIATTRTFPTVSLCHFQTFEYGDKQSSGKWVQCILTINIFLEKLFLIEWFWLLMLLVLTSISFCVWCFRILQTHTAVRFVSNYMKLMGIYSPHLHVPQSCSKQQFVMEYLRSDGVFVLRILAVNTNEVIVAGLVEELWKRYIQFDKNPENISMEMDEIENVTALNRDEKKEEGVRV